MKVFLIFLQLPFSDLSVSPSLACLWQLQVTKEDSRDIVDLNAASDRFHFASLTLIGI